MAVIKAHVPEEVKKQFQQAAKDSKKYESELLRLAIQNMLAVKKVPR
jgi:hypothetical protein